MQEKESIMAVRYELKIPSLGITVRHHSASLVMPDSYSRDGILNPHLTAIKGSYNACQVFPREAITRNVIISVLVICVRVVQMTKGVCKSGQSVNLQRTQRRQSAKPNSPLRPLATHLRRILPSGRAHAQADTSSRSPPGRLRRAPAQFHLSKINMILLSARVSYAAFTDHSKPMCVNILRYFGDI